MVSFPKYDSYKDSGVQWLGDIPEHWEVKRLKYLAKIKNGQEYKLVRTDDIGYPVIGSGGQFAYASKYLFKGESVLLGRKGTIDKPLYVNCSFWTVDTMFYTEIKNNTFPKFLYYSTLTIPFKYFSTNTAVPSMTQEDLSNNFLVYPPIEEQQKIAKFLDEKTGEIEEAISHKQRLIELLQEQKAILINQAVTKGLNPNVPMRDSGIEWLGDIPEHWEVMAIKRTARKGYKTFVDGDWVESPYITNEGIRLIQTGNVGIGIYKEKGFRYITKKTFSKLNCTEIFTNNVLICRLDGPVGRACLVPDLGVRMITSVDNTILKQSDNFDPRFITYTLSSDLWLNWIKSLCRVGGGFRFRISRSILGNLKIPAPPLNEQVNIANFIDKQEIETNNAIELIKQQIDKLNELKQILITAYLWTDILTPESLTNIIEHFAILVTKKNKKNNKITKNLYFPRYHQLEVVRKLIKDTKDNGIGKTYLIQHSAGS